MTSKLCVAGCSFSDYTKVDKVYGEYLAEKLGYDYVHEAAGCGSNWRIWRRVYQLIRDDVITSNDLLIIQYTITERQEFYSRFRIDHSVDKKQNMREPFGDGDIIRYKMDSYTWQKTPQDKKFLKMYQQNHVDLDFAELQFECFHSMFQSYLKSNNINTIFFKSGYRSTLDLLPEFEQKSFFKNDCSSPPNNLADNDHAHMNDLGHRRLAEHLHNHLAKIGIA